MFLISIDFLFERGFAISLPSVTHPLRLLTDFATESTRSELGSWQQKNDTADSAAKINETTARRESAASSA
jgi:hypothetical protein